VRFEEAQSGAESAVSVAEDTDAVRETLVHEWRQSPTGSRAEEPTSVELDVVNMPVKRNLDAWCFAEHMDMPVLLQVA